MDEDALINGQIPAEADPDPAPSPAEPVPIPDHQLLRCIGRGSYGAVWLARNLMGMYRAVKIVYRKSFQDERPFERELSGIRKFEPISRSYEGFVDVLHVGIHDAQGCFYYVMELGDDQNSGQAVDPASYSPKTLAKELSIRGKLSLPECLQLGLALSQALAELHKHGLVHRDVKPSNLIFVNGVPKLADIGLVAEVGEARSYVGTEGFIPPEGPGTPQADVYSLGKVLYECCTGKDRQEFPELPTLLDQVPDREGFLELNEVILQACKNDPDKRYRTAWDMHADLLVLANGKSVKRLKTLERRLANLKRIASISAVTLVVAAAIFYHGYREWRTVLDARQRQVGANTAYGSTAMESGNLLEALPYFGEALRLTRKSPRQETDHRLRYGATLAQGPKLNQFLVTGVRLNDGEFSPDGNRILIAGHYDKARIYDLQSGEIYSDPFGGGLGLRGAAYSRDGLLLVTANEDQTARILNAVTLEEIGILPHTNRVFSACFSPDGLHALTSCKDGVARVWDLRTREVVMSLKHTNAVLFSDYSRDGRLIVTTSYDYTARIWATNGQIIGKPLFHGGWVSSAAFSYDNQKLLTGSHDHKARVWKVQTGEQILPSLTHGSGVNSVEFSPDNRLILSASSDGTARLWAADSLQPLGSNHVLRHGDPLMRATFGPAGHRLLTICVDGTLRVWDLAGSTWQPATVPYSFSPDGNRFLNVLTNSIQVCDVPSARPVSPVIRVNLPIDKAQLNRNGTFAVTVSIPRPEANGAERLLQVWNVATGNEVSGGIELTNQSPGFRLSDNGKRLVTYDTKSVWIWDAQPESRRSLAWSSTGPIGSVYLSRDATRIATRSGADVQVWHAGSGRALFAPWKHIAPVGHVEFSADGTRLITSCWDAQFTKCYAQVWNASTGEAVGPPLKHGDGVLFASFSPDGARVVTAGEDYRAVVWDAVTGKPLTPPLHHGEKVRTAAFSPDGKWIVTASSDRTARVWNSETGDSLTPPLRHLTALMSARFLADGRSILTTDEQGITRVWKLPVDDRPVEDLMPLAALLSGNSVALAGQLTVPQSESLESIWQRLRPKYPSSFTTSAEEIAAWHEFQVQECELQREWWAAAFHLRRLLAIRPGDKALVQRFARAEAEQKSQSSVDP